MKGVIAVSPIDINNIPRPDHPAGARQWLLNERPSDPDNIIHGSTMVAAPKFEVRPLGCSDGSAKHATLERCTPSRGYFERDGTLQQCTAVANEHAAKSMLTCTNSGDSRVTECADGHTLCRANSSVGFVVSEARTLSGLYVPLAGKFCYGKPIYQADETEDKSRPRLPVAYPTLMLFDGQRWVFVVLMDTEAEPPNVNWLTDLERTGVCEYDLGELGGDAVSEPAGACPDSPAGQGCAGKWVRLGTAKYFYEARHLQPYEPVPLRKWVRVGRARDIKSKMVVIPFEATAAGRCSDGTVADAFTDKCTPDQKTLHDI